MNHLSMYSLMDQKTKMEMQDQATLQSAKIDTTDYKIIITWEKM